MVLVALFFVAGCADTNRAGRRQNLFVDPADCVPLNAFLRALLGALEGQKIARNTRSTLFGAGIGLMGGRIGDLRECQHVEHVADQKASFDNDEDYLTACIASAQRVIQHTDIYNSELRSNISKYKKNIRRLVKRINRNKVSVAEMQKEKQNLENMIAQQDVNRQAIYEQIAKYQGAIENGQNANNQTIAALNGKIQRLT